MQLHGMGCLFFKATSLLCGPDPYPLGMSLAMPCTVMPQSRLLSCSTSESCVLYVPAVFLNCRGCVLAVQVANCISQDLSWAKPALKWEGVLEDLFYGSSGSKATSVLTPVSEMIPGPVPAVTKAGSKEKIVGPDPPAPVIAAPSPPTPVRAGGAPSIPKPAPAPEPVAVIAPVAPAGVSHLTATTAPAALVTAKADAAKAATVAAAAKTEKAGSVAIPVPAPKVVKPEAPKAKEQAVSPAAAVAAAKAPAPSTPKA